MSNHKNREELANRVSLLFEKTEVFNTEVADAINECVEMANRFESEAERLRKEVGDWISRGVAYEGKISGLQSQCCDMRQQLHVATGRELKLQAKVRTACIQFWLMAIVAVINLVVGILS